MAASHFKTPSIVRLSRESRYSCTVALDFKFAGRLALERNPGLLNGL
jgi:hypothetical protein